MRKGFTLVELLIVIIIIGILATMAVPQYQKMVNRAKWAEAISLIDSLKTAENLYYAENSKWTTAKISASTTTNHYFDSYVDTSTIAGNRNFDFSAFITGKAGILYAVPHSYGLNDDFTSAGSNPYYCYDVTSNTTSSGNGYPNM